MGTTSDEHDDRREVDPLVARWQRIRRGEEAFGPGEPAEQASQFYFEHVLPSLCDRVERRWARDDPRAVRECDLLVSLSGFSPETTVIAARLLRPRVLFVLSSRNASDSVDAIHRRVVGRGEGQILPQRFYHEECDPTDPLDVYQLIRHRLERVREDGAPPKPRAIIDVTGGKKVMSAAAALAAWRLDLPLCYIESDYDPVMRIARPGTERLLLLGNPATLYGEEEARSVSAVFDAGHFSDAVVRFSALAERIIGDVSFLRFMRDLSEMYRAWCDLDLPAVERAAGLVEERLQSPGATGRLRADHVVRVRRQTQFLRGLAGGRPENLLLSFFLLGRHYAALKRLDFAALLFYRTIEGSFRERLERRFPGFNATTPDYGPVLQAAPDMVERYLEICRQVSPGGAARDALPRSVGCVDAAALLLAAGDEMLGHIPIRDAGGLGHLRGLADTRNRSILAHGYKSVEPGECDALRGLAQRVLDAFWRTDNTAAGGEWGEGVADLCDALDFVRGVG